MLTGNNDNTKNDRQLLPVMIAGGTIVLAALAVALWRDYQSVAGEGWLINLSQTIASALPTTWQAALSEQTRLMGLPFTEESKAFWYMARAGGVIAYLLLWMATCWGIMMSSKFIKGMVDFPLAFALHEYLPIVGVVFAAFHAVILLGDSFIAFKPWQLLIPFASPYKPIWTGLGTLAFYFFMALIASFYVRKRIGQKAWRIFHYTSYLAFLIALLHGVMAGSDSGAMSMQLMYLVTGGLSLFFLYYRMLAHSPRNRTAPATGGRNRSSVEG